MEEKRLRTIIFTDGAARGNPNGPGGYGAIVRIRDEAGNILEKELSGGFPETTNNRMELMAPIAALEELGKLGRPCEGLIYSDSRYLVDAFEKNWIKNWQKNGWVTSSKTPVKNQDLWNRMLGALAPHAFRFRWVKGHADHPENERCDKLATAAADKVGWSLEQAGRAFSQASEWTPLPADNSLAGTGRPGGDGTRGKTTGPAAAASKKGKAPQTMESLQDGPDTLQTEEGFPAGISTQQAGKGRSGGTIPASVLAAQTDSGSAGMPVSPQRIRIRYLSDRIEKLQPPTNSGNWVDLRAAEDVILKEGEFRLIRLGVAMKLPDGYEAHVVPRSSTFKNFGIIQANQFGVIDSAYCGNGDEWRMPVIALRDTQIHINDRICQFRIMRRQPDLVFEETDRLEDADRGGFGSTGIV